jgi:hypothetical protein
VSVVEAGWRACVMDRQSRSTAGSTGSAVKARAAKRRPTIRLNARASITKLCKGAQNAHVAAPMEHYPAPDAALLCMLCDMVRSSATQEATEEPPESCCAANPLERVPLHRPPSDGEDVVATAAQYPSCCCRSLSACCDMLEVVFAYCRGG